MFSIKTFLVLVTGIYIQSVQTPCDNLLMVISLGAYYVLQHRFQTSAYQVVGAAFAGVSDQAQAL